MYVKHLITNVIIVLALGSGRPPREAKVSLVWSDRQKTMKLETKPTNFSRAFRQSTGVSPHQWLLKRRADQTKSLLRDRTLPLSDVALSCGFADQSHFTRVFARLAGISPGAWRRNLD